MPKITVEYSKNLTDQQAFDPRTLLVEINKAVNSVGEFKEQNIRSVIHCNDVFVVGIHPENRAFIEVSIQIIDGRSFAIKNDVTTRVLNVLKAQVKPVGNLGINFSVDVSDLNRNVFVNEVFVTLPNT
ncbi:5-carboxymethyl-2-hydroxymuconate Delta-isomerase [Zophobihabitans entericus]|uniref:Uncharacterized protein n=1 Tax=Zophobihabitans entericus TaxID=1635327 RepID=A0A6G9IBV6_9GAMM|nr:hypothetical protein [Zophobihabitans entericus]QIQ21693.1 hypothetical protein IPMB12_08370 [Zophobihabitans entericus]